MTLPIHRDLSDTAKGLLAWGGVGVAKSLETIGINSWSDAAAACAAIYSIILIGEWLYKKVKT